MTRRVICCACRKPKAQSPCKSCRRRRNAERRVTDWYQSREWAALKRAARKIFKRCAICGSTERLTFHHIHAREDGGPDTVENLAPLCGSHHSSYEAQKRAGRTTQLVKQVESLKGGPV